MMIIDYGGGMVFPNRYDRDQDDGPDPCDECDGAGWVVRPSSDGLGEGLVPCDRCNGTGQVG